MEKYPRREEHVVWKVVGGKGVLLHLESGEYFEVDPVGLSIWERCDGKTPLEKIAQAVAEKFSEKVERVYQDLTHFVAGLRRRKLLEVV